MRLILGLNAAIQLLTAYILTKPLFDRQMVGFFPPNSDFTVQSADHSRTVTTSNTAAN